MATVSGIFSARKAALAAAGLILAIGTTAYNAAIPSKKPDTSRSFEPSGPALAGTATNSSDPVLEILGFALGQCAFPPGAAKPIAKAAEMAAEQSKSGGVVSVVITGGADGTPISKLRPDCEILAPDFVDNPNLQLAAARSAMTKQAFVIAFKKSGGRRLELAESTPVVTTNVDRPSDRKAVLNIIWRNRQPKTSKRMNDD
jgi:hypothetical protein